MTGVETKDKGTNLESNVTLVLQGWEVYGSLIFHLFLFLVNLIVYWWSFASGSKLPIESFGVKDLLNSILILGLFCVMFYLIAKAVLVQLYSAKRIVREGDSVLVERVLGRWRGPARKLRLRKASFGWIGTLGSSRYQLVLADGRLVAEIIMLRNLLEDSIKPRRPLEESVALLRQWIQDAEEGQEHLLQRLRAGVTNVLRDGLSSFSRRWRWVGKILWWGQMIGAYVALLVALLIFSKLSWVSLSAMLFILVEAFVALGLLGAMRAGRGVNRGIRSAFSFLQVTVGVFVVSVAWDWLGAMHGYVGLVAIVGVLQVMAVVFEWAEPGAVFLAFGKPECDKPSAGET